MKTNKKADHHDILNSNDNVSEKLKTYEITNGLVSLEVLNWGGIITKLLFPDNQGDLTNVVLNYDSIDDYLIDELYIGGIIGRYANRIENGKFFLKGHEFNLFQNNNSNHLHGGQAGFNKVFWNVSKKQENILELSYLSTHLEEGFPGDLEIIVQYEITQQNEVIISYQAKTNRSTVINLTNHAYFNLSNTKNDNVLEHNLEVYSDSILELDDNMIPTGKIKNIEKSAFDFKRKKMIGKSIKSKAEELIKTNGYDHCYVFDTYKLETMAKLSCEQSGIQMTIKSTEPGMQLYTGNFLKKPFEQHEGVCLETQHFPNSPNIVCFPSTSLEPNEIYMSKTILKLESICT